MIFFYSYAIFMYFNFSGYCDIVIAAAKLIGLTLPENFNRPYVARNVIDYWNRWHISLTHWIRDYVFMSSYKVVVKRSPARAKQLGYGLLFLSLFLAGVWHGSTAGFAVFGAIHGIGAATNQFYADTLRSWLGREGFNKYLRNRFYRVAAFCSRCITSVSRSCSSHPACRGRSNPEDGGPLDSVWPATSVRAAGLFGGAIVMLVPLLILVSFYRDAILVAPQPIRAAHDARNRSLYVTVLMKTLFVAFILIFLWGLEKEPEIAYMRF